MSFVLLSSLHSRTAWVLFLLSRYEVPITPVGAVGTSSQRRTNRLFRNGAGSAGGRECAADVQHHADPSLPWASELRNDCQRDPGSGDGENCKRLTNRSGCLLFRLAPDSVAGVATEVHRHLGAHNGFDLGAVAGATSRIGTSIRSSPVIDRVRRCGHVEPGGLMLRPRTARMLSGIPLRPSAKRRTEERV